MVIYKGFSIKWEAKLLCEDLCSHLLYFIGVKCHIFKGVSLPPKLALLMDVSTEAPC